MTTLADLLAEADPPELPTTLLLDGTLHSWSSDQAATAMSSFLVSDETPFVAWSENYVFFPVHYDSPIWIDWLPVAPTTEFSPAVLGGG